jgi:DNA primase
MKYLNLILTITILFQYQRPRHTMDYDGEREEYILVTLDDIARANEIANDVLGRSLDELSPSSRKLLLLIKDMCSQKTEDRGQMTEGEREEITFTRRDIREFSGWSDFQVKTHIKQLEELEYLSSLTGRKGKEYLYELIYKGGGEDEENRKFLIGLADIKEVRRKAEGLGISDPMEGSHG